ncbi:MAG: hypothetical protein IPL08_02415 [Saprospiraceae bacterium]|nr:hypothetical protein [Saprospiraceae bacterium]
MGKEAILECVLGHLIAKSEVEKSMNIYITDANKWTDSTSYVSITIDTKNLYKQEGEFWTSKYKGYKIHQFLTSVDTSISRNIEDLTQTTANRLKWNKQTKKFIENNEEFSPPYNPPKIHFIYNPNKKCVEKYLAEGEFKEVLIKLCKLCSETS